MEIRPLDRNQVKTVYRAHMTRDFPDDERKPLMMILRAMRSGKYICLGAFRGDELTGYAFFVKRDNHLLLDYFAVVSGMRDSGIGSRMLQLLAERFRDAGSVIAEVEDPDAAGTEPERQTRIRRLQFYLRNGFLDSGITVSTFGVLYRLLELPTDHPHSPENVKAIYSETYRSMLPKRMYEANVRV